MKYQLSNMPESLVRSTTFIAALFPIMIVVGLTGWLFSSPDSAPLFAYSGTAKSYPGTLIGPSLSYSLLMVSAGISGATLLGISTAVYIVELSPPLQLVKWLETTLYNMAGVPTVLYGLAGVLIFDDKLLASDIFWPGAFTLGLVALPIIVVASVQALRAVPSSLREGALGLGASPWEATRHVVLPIAMPSVLTGIVLALARILGEAAALLILYGAISTASDQTRVLPVRIYEWLSSGKPALIAQTGTAVAVLLICMACITGVASIYRRRYREIR
jgi:phosphate transport system permease protein